MIKEKLFGTIAIKLSKIHVKDILKLSGLKEYDERKVFMEQ
jgi:hypothetical protein